MVRSNITDREGNFLTQIQSRLDQVQRLAGEVEQRVADARSILRAYSGNQGIPGCESLAEIIMEAAKDSEYLTERLRRMTLELTPDPVRYREYTKELVRIQGIRVKYMDRILSVELPVLVPHRKSQYTDYLYKPLYIALQDWCRERLSRHMEIPRFCKATVCFIHCYDKKLPLARVRDNDNIEEKHILDVLESFFLKSDSGIYVDTYHETKLHDADRTYLFVMPQEVFPGWIVQKHAVQEHIEKGPDNQL